MGILDDLYGKVRAVNDGLTGGSLIREVITRFESDVLELQRKQLFEGKAGTGEDLRPYYSEDLQPGGYFRDKEAAKQYSVWKQGLSYPYSAQRNPDAPNLYINGTFHSELGVRFDADAMAVVPTSAFSQRVMKKYGEGQFGLMWINWNEIMFVRGGYDGILDEVKKELR